MGAFVATQNLPFLQQDLIGNRLGFFSNYSRSQVIGRRTLIGNSRVDLWEGPTDQYVFPSVGQQFQVQSTSANDTAGGTGIQSVHVHMLDSAYGYSVATVNMNGLTPVNIGPANGFRVLVLHATALGSGGYAAGNISLTGPGAAVTYAYIPAGFRISRQAVYTVPAGYTGYINFWRASSGSANPHVCSTTLEMTAHDGIVYPGVMLAQDEIQTQDGSEGSPMPTPLIVPSTVDVKLSSIGDALNAGITSSGAIFGYLQPNNV